MRAVALFAVLLAVTGCGESSVPPPPGPLQIGAPGRTGGFFHQPRYLAVDDGAGELYVIDRTDRMQVFSLDGVFKRGWLMPDREAGNCRGMSWDAARDRLWIADTHNRRILMCDRDGTITSVGGRAGQFNLVTDIAPASGAPGRFWVSQYDDGPGHAVFLARIAALEAASSAPAELEIEELGHFGTQGGEPGNWNIPSALVPMDDGTAWVSNANNHRIDRIAQDGHIVATAGAVGSGAGELRYPYDIATWRTASGEVRLAVAEFGNNRVSVFTGDGVFVRHIAPAGCVTPWGIAVSSARWLFVASTGAHVVLRVPLPA